MLPRRTWPRLSLSAPFLGVAMLHAQSTPPAEPQPPVAATAAQAAPAPQEVQGGTISGTVTSATVADSNGRKPAGTPLPGVTITATNTLTGKKYTAATDIAGTFRMTIPRNGRYVIRAEFAAFAPATAEVLLNATQHCRHRSVATGAGLTRRRAGSGNIRHSGCRRQCTGVVTRSAGAGHGRR